MKFYLGAQNPAWLAEANVPLFYEVGNLTGNRRLPTPSCDWALDSGAYGELARHGRWRLPSASYFEIVQQLAQLGRLDFAVPQDWVVSPQALKATGLTVSEHQRRTVGSYILARTRAPELCWLLPLQGRTLGDFEDHVEMYREAGIQPALEPVVGLGSVADRNEAVAFIAHHLAREGIRLHGFGVKAQGLAQFAEHLVSADSMAWCATARYNRDAKTAAWAKTQPILRECIEEARNGDHPKSCRNCLRWALHWRKGVLAAACDRQRVAMGQKSLFAQPPMPPLYERALRPTAPARAGGTKTNPLWNERE